MRTLGQCLPSSPQMPSPWSSKEGTKQIFKVSVSYHTHSDELSLGTGAALWLPTRGGSSWLNLEPFCHLICKSWGLVCSYVSKKQSSAGSSWEFLSPAPPPQHLSRWAHSPQHLPRWAHPPQHRLSPLTFLVLLLISNLSDVKPLTHR